MEWDETAHDDGRVVVLRLTGEVDLYRSPRLREWLRGKLDLRIPSLILDFSEVTYIDSSGLATLVEYLQHSRPFSGKLALAGLTDRVRSVIELVGLEEVFRIYPTLEAASEGERGSGMGQP